MTVTHAQHPAVFRRPAFHLPAVLRLPELHGAVFARRRQNFRIPAPAQRGHRRLVPAQREQFLPVLRIPDAHAAIAVRRRQHLSVRTERNRRDPVRVLFDLMLNLSRLRRPHFDNPAWPAHRDLRLVRTNVCRDDRVIVVTDGGNPLAGHHIPHHDATRQRRLASVRQQQLSAAAEFHALRLAFRKRQHPRQLQRVAVKQQHLFLPGHRHQRCPGTRSQSRDRIRARRMQHRSQRQILRHRRRPIGLASRVGFQRQIRGRRARNDGFSARILQQTILNPLFENFQILVTQLRPVGRHEWLLRMRNRLPQLAPVRIARRHHRS